MSAVLMLVFAAIAALVMLALATNAVAAFVVAGRAIAADRWVRISTIGLIALLAALIVT